MDPVNQYISADELPGLPHSGIHGHPDDILLAEVADAALHADVPKAVIGEAGLIHLFPIPLENIGIALHGQRIAGVGNPQILHVQGVILVENFGILNFDLRIGFAPQADPDNAREILTEIKHIFPIRQPGHAHRLELPHFADRLHHLRAEHAARRGQLHHVEARPAELGELLGIILRPAGEAVTEQRPPAFGYILLESAARQVPFRALVVGVVHLAGINGGRENRGNGKHPVRKPGTKPYAFAVFQPRQALKQKAGVGRPAAAQHHADGVIARCQQRRNVIGVVVNPLGVIGIGRLQQVLAGLFAVYPQLRVAVACQVHPRPHHAGRQRLMMAEERHRAAVVRHADKNPVPVFPRQQAGLEQGGRCVRCPDAAAQSLHRPYIRGAGRERRAVIGTGAGIGEDRTAVPIRPLLR